MVKYELKKDSVEVKYKDRKNIRSGIVLAADDRVPEVIKLFSNKDEALNELQKYKSSIAKLSNHGMSYYLIEEYYVEENIYDEEGECVEYGDVLECSKMEIELVEEPSYNRLAVFDNMADAENAKDDYEGENEVYLSF